VM
ncbi:hypothetical protein MIMGU_mgv1a0024532mg, partial [Erythranthe guttata]|jgi:hypothetical protein